MRSLVLASAIAFLGLACGSSSSSTPAGAQGGSAPGVSGGPGEPITQPWNGEPINVDDDGPLRAAGGPTLVVAVDPNTIVVRADWIAVAGSSSATLSMGLSTDAIDVGCKSLEGPACQSLTVTVPAGTAARPLDVTVRSTGAGDLVTNGALLVRKLEVTHGGGGNVDVQAAAVAGATIDVQGAFDVTVRLPASFAADMVVLSGPSDPSSIDTRDFDGMKSGAAFGPEGARATSLTVRTEVGGTIAIRKY